MNLRHGQIHILYLFRFPPLRIKILIDNYTIYNTQSKLRIVNPKLRNQQNASLSPILSNIFINDISKITNTKLGLYGDDTAVFAVSLRKNQARFYLNLHVELLEQYFEQWKIQVNDGKKFIHNFYMEKRDRNPTPVTFSVIEIQNRIQSYILA